MNVSLVLFAVVEISLIPELRTSEKRRQNIFSSSVVESTEKCVDTFHYLWYPIHIHTYGHTYSLGIQGKNRSQIAKSSKLNGKNGNTYVRPLSLVAF